MVLQDFDRVGESQFQYIEVRTVWWLIRQLHPNAVVLHSLHDNTIFPSGVCLGIIFLDNATLRSGGPFMFDFWYHLFDQHLRHLHPIDAVDTLCFHCACQMILARFFC